MKKFFFAIFLLCMCFPSFAANVIQLSTDNDGAIEWISRGPLDPIIVESRYNTCFEVYMEIYKTDNAGKALSGVNMGGNIYPAGSVVGKWIWPGYSVDFYADNDSQPTIPAAGKLKIRTLPASLCPPREKRT